MTSPETPAPNDPSAPVDDAEPAAAPAPADTDPVADPAKPPLPWLLAYRVLGLRLPAEYRLWVAQDVTSKLFLTWRIARTYLWFLVLLGVVYTAATLSDRRPGTTRVVQALLITLAVSLLSSGTTLVRRTLRWQRIDRRGRPVRPKGAAVLSNQEAVVAGALVLVLVAGGTAAVTWLLFRPTGFNAVACRAPDDVLQARLRGGLKDTSQELVRPQQIPLGQSQLVGTYLTKPGDKNARLAFWLIEGETIYELRDPVKEETAVSTFGLPPAADRLAPEAVRRVFDCMNGKG